MLPQIRAIASLIFFAASLAQAAVPSAINYQGYLTDASGAAVDGPLSVTFSIYTVDSGGSPLWTETQVVPLDSGLFSLSLGGAAAPFPVGLFDTPLWVGIAVDADPEMTPRRALTTAAFSFKADDASSLQGQGPAAFDQSAHVADSSNPHAVDSTQTGASGELNSHASEAAAHHARFTDAEAFGAVLASDGMGSGLDADTVDGIQGQAVIDLGSQLGAVDGRLGAVEANNVLSAISATAGGNVGIGTASPVAPLHVVSTSNLPLLLSTSSPSGTWLKLENTDDAGTGWSIISRNNGELLTYNSVGGTVSHRATNGNMAIGNIVPESRLHVVGGSDASLAGGGYIVTGPTTGANMVMDNNEIIARFNGGPGTLFLNNDGGDVVVATNSGGNNGRLGIGKFPTAMLDVAGTAKVHVVQITGGADIVEGFDSTQDLEPGTVVVIDSVHAGDLIASNSIYDRKVAGVVSGANGILPGLMLGQEGVLDGDVHVAMSGRVYVKASAENGPIEPGDRLTTASLTGHAMKVTDETRAGGSVMGKAMSSLDKGTGLVLVLVNLQ